MTSIMSYFKKNKPNKMFAAQNTVSKWNLAREQKQSGHPCIDARLNLHIRIISPKMSPIQNTFGTTQLRNGPLILLLNSKKDCSSLILNPSISTPDPNHQLGVNFINVRCTNFLYERRFSSYVLALSKILYKKFARLKLMKLTVELVVNKQSVIGHT